MAEEVEVYVEDKTKLYYSISHGSYTKDKPSETFNIPDNIRLIQFSKPSQLLSYLEVLYILDHFDIDKLDLVSTLNNKIDNAYFVHKSLHKFIDIVNSNDVNNLIYKTNINLFITNPNEETLNMDLDFTGDNIPLKEVYFESSDEGLTQIIREPKYKLNLKDYLYNISNDLKKHDKYNNFILNILQFSCRAGSIEKVDSLELSRMLLGVSLSDNYKSINDILNDFKFDLSSSLDEKYNIIKNEFFALNNEEIAVSNVNKIKEYLNTYLTNINSILYPETSLIKDDNGDLIEKLLKKIEDRDIIPQGSPEIRSISRIDRPIDFERPISYIRSSSGERPVSKRGRSSTAISVPIRIESDKRKKGRFERRGGNKKRTKKVRFNLKKNKKTLRK